MALEITHYGHSCFLLDDGESRVIVDPFLAPHNPVAPLTADQVNATHVLITHGHIDHMADAIGVAEHNHAPCVALVEIATWLQEQGLGQVHDPNFGGTVEFGWGTVKMVQAFHTSTIASAEGLPYSPTTGTVIGPAGGLIIRIGGLCVYVAGDTALFGDMELIGRRELPDVAILPIGGHYTMDRHDAVYAAELIGAGKVIPCHFDTFPLIETDSDAWAAEIEAQGRTAIVMRPGETRSLAAS